MIKIGYRIGGSFEDYCKDGNVGFEILFGSSGVMVG